MVNLRIRLIYIFNDIALYLSVFEKLLSNRLKYTKPVILFNSKKRQHKLPTILRWHHLIANVTKPCEK